MGKRALTKKEIGDIKRLRLTGHSVSEIHELTKKGRATISRYIQGVRLTPDYLRMLRSRQGGSRKRKETNIKIARQLAQSLLAGSKREAVIVMAMLYWAEGHKQGGCEFTNTDGRMVALYLKILRSVLKIQQDRIHITIRIFKGMKKKDCLRHWSGITNIPTRKIRVRVNDGGTSGNTKYGICRVVIRKGQDLLKLMHALVDNVVKTY